MAFRGFTPGVIEYLSGLRDNNNREWFLKHKAGHDALLKEPMKLMGGELLTAMKGVERSLKVSYSRMNRDVRFSKDKSPYRPNMWLALGKPVPNWKEEPVFFFEIFPDKYWYGMGFYMARPDFMRAFREKIAANPRALLFATSFHREKKKRFTLGGDDYKKISFPDGLPEELREWYTKKTFFVFRERPIEKLLFTKKLKDEIEADLMTISPLYEYLNNITAK